MLLVIAADVFWFSALGAVILWSVRRTNSEKRKARHAACLRAIARLQRESDPEPAQNSV
jgi:hypothetical protein